MMQMAIRMVAASQQINIGRARLEIKRHFDRRNTRHGFF